MRKKLEVIDFPAPYTDEQTIGQIGAYVQDLLGNELPAFQVDVGDDLHLSGTLAVQRAIEQKINDVHAGITPTSNLPFRYIHQSMRAPFYVHPSHARSKTLTPHLDSGQVGLAIHKEYVGHPTKVQFCHVPKGVELPPVTEDYRGADLAEITGTAYEGITQLGRLSIFSQGNPHWDLQPAAHYYERQPDQLIGGRYTRYSMLDPESAAYPNQADSYEQLAEMRKTAAIHLDWRQWQMLSGELAGAKDAIHPDDYVEHTALTEMHLANHPGKEYLYWSVSAEDAHTYGVIPKPDESTPAWFIQPQ